MTGNRRKISAALRLVHSYFTKTEKRWVIKAAASQILFAFFDLVGVALVGVLGAVAISGVGSTIPGNRVGRFLDFFGLTGVSFQAVAGILSISAILVLTIRTLISMFSTRKILNKLSYKSAEISASIFNKVQRKNLDQIEEIGFFQTQYAITSGVESLVVRVYGTVLTLVTDLTLIVIMSATLIYIDPILAVSTFVLFGFTGMILYLSMHKSASKRGMENAILEIKSSEIISSGLNLFREIRLRDGARVLTDSLKRTRVQHSKTVSSLNFLPYLGKYIVETMLIIGTVVIAGIQFYLHDAIHAAATISIFMAAGSRIAPSFLRLQQGLVTIRGSLGMADKTLTLLEVEMPPLEKECFREAAPEWVSKVSVSDVSFKYADQPNWTLKSICFEVVSGEVVAIVGPSGSGKSTIADLVIGVILPSQGEILISGVSPEQAVIAFPGKIAYVPQDVQILTGSIRENLLIGLEPGTIPDAKLIECLIDAGLGEMFTDSSVQLDSDITAFGVQLSGGEKQRFGIARALITDPQILILDEATSALDATTESSITKMLDRRKGNLTTLIIAHRLSTVREADRVLYVSDGQIIASGSFSEVRNSVPGFEEQASLMGL
jgi:ABC-type multidrug transport system fused ATPase/permease subunit